MNGLDLRTSKVGFFLTDAKKHVLKGVYSACTLPLLYTPWCRPTAFFYFFFSMTKNPVPRTNGNWKIWVYKYMRQVSAHLIPFSRSRLTIFSSSSSSSSFYFILWAGGLGLIKYMDGCRLSTRPNGQQAGKIYFRNSFANSLLDCTKARQCTSVLTRTWQWHTHSGQPVTTPPKKKKNKKKTTSFFGNPRTLVGYTPTVSLRFGSKLPHRC